MQNPTVLLLQLSCYVIFSCTFYHFIRPFEKYAPKYDARYFKLPINDLVSGKN